MGLKLCSCLQGGVVELKLYDLKLMTILDPKATHGYTRPRGGREGGSEEGKERRAGTSLLYGEFCVTASPPPLLYATLAGNC